MVVKPQVPARIRRVRQVLFKIRKELLGELGLLKIRSLGRSVDCLLGSFSILAQGDGIVMKNYQNQNGEYHRDSIEKRGEKKTATTTTTTKYACSEG